MPQERAEKRIDQLPTLASVAAGVNLPGEFEGVAYKFTAQDFKNYAGGDTILSQQDTDGKYVNHIVDGGGGSGGSMGSIDSALSDSSENAVQNKVIKAALDGKISAPASPSSGDFLVYNGTAWAAVTLSEWQGGSY